MKNYFLPLLLSACLLTGCDLTLGGNQAGCTGGGDTPINCSDLPPFSPPYFPDGAFSIQTQIVDVATVPGIVYPEGGVTVAGQWKGDLAGDSGGSLESFVTVTPPSGLQLINNARTPADWALEWLLAPSGPGQLCDSPGEQIRPVAKYGLEYVNCWIFPDLESTAAILPSRNGGIIANVSPSTGQVGSLVVADQFTISPNPYAVGDYYQIASVYGDNIPSQYGMPLIQVYDVNGQLVIEDYATEVDSTGQELEFPGTDLQNLVAGTYTGFITGIDASGNASVYAGTFSITVNNSDANVWEFAGDGGCY